MILISVGVDRRSGGIVPVPNPAPKEEKGRAVFGSGVAAQLPLFLHPHSPVGWAREVMAL